MRQEFQTAIPQCKHNTEEFPVFFPLLLQQLHKKYFGIVVYWHRLEKLKMRVLNLLCTCLCFCLSMHINSTFSNQTKVPLSLKRHYKYLQEKEVSFDCTFHLKCWFAPCFWKNVQNVLVTYVKTMWLQLIPSRIWCYINTEHKPTVQPAVSCAYPSIRMGIPKDDALKERGWAKDNIYSNYRLMIAAVPCCRYPPQNLLWGGRECLGAVTLRFVNKVNPFWFCFKEIVTQGTIDVLQPRPVFANM